MKLSWLGSTKFTLFSPTPNSPSLFFPTLLYTKLLTILSSVFLFLNLRLVFSLQSLIAFWYLLYLEFPARCTNRNYDAANSRLLVFHNQDYFAIKTYLSRTVRAYNSLPYSTVQKFNPCSLWDQVKTVLSTTIDTPLAHSCCTHSVFLLQPFFFVLRQIWWVFYLIILDVVGGY